MEPTIHHDVAGRRFVAKFEGQEAVLLYESAGERIVDFRSTYVPNAWRGRRVGTRLVRHALDWAREQGLAVIPSCWFVGVVAERFPEYRDLVRR